MKFSIDRMLIAAIILTVVSVGIVLYVSNKQSEKLKSTSAAVSATEKALIHLQKLILSALDNETGASGYVITRNESFLTPIKQSEADLFSEQKILENLYTGKADKMLVLDSINYFIIRRIDFTKKIITARQTSGQARAVELVDGGEGKRYTEKIRELSLNLERSEANQLSSLKEYNASSMQRLKTILNIILGITFVLAIVIIFRVWGQFHYNERVKQELNVLNAQINEAHDSIYTVNVNLRITNWNKGAEALYGYTHREAIGKDSNTLLRTDLSKEEIAADIKEINEKKILGWRTKKKNKSR